MACARSEGIGTVPKFAFLGAKGQIFRAYTLYLAELAHNLKSMIPNRKRLSC